MTQFDIDYKKGKESEILSLPDLQRLFKKDLILDPETFAHFDYHKDNIKERIMNRNQNSLLFGNVIMNIFTGK